MDVKRQPNRHPQNSPSRAVIESAPAVQALSEEDRAFVIDKLAEMLVLDYQANQGVLQPTVKTPSVHNHRAEGEARRTP